MALTVSNPSDNGCRQSSAARRAANDAGRLRPRGGSHYDNIAYTLAQVRSKVGLRSHHANQVILVEGDRLPIRFAMSHPVKAAGPLEVPVTGRRMIAP
jgi:hypothetical protein